MACGVHELCEPDVGDARRVLADQVHVRVEQGGVHGLAVLAQHWRQQTDGRRKQKSVQSSLKTGSKGFWDYLASVNIVNRHDSHLFFIIIIILTTPAYFNLSRPFPHQIVILRKNASMAARERHL